MSEIRVDNIIGEDGGTPVGFSKGINISSGVVTATTFKGALEGNSTTATTATNVSGGSVSGTTGTFSSDVTGTNLELSGNLTVRGTQTIINTETLDVQDATVGIASTSTASNVTANNAGITIYGSTDGSNDKNLTWGKDPGSFLVNQPWKFKGVYETVSAATTYYMASQLVVEMDAAAGTAYSYTVPGNTNIGIVSFKNIPAVSGEETFTTVTLLTTQNSGFANAGWGNTQSVSGIGSQVTVVGFSSGLVAGISTRGFVNTGVTTFVGVTTFPGYTDFISFGIHYNGKTNTDANSYDVYITNNGGWHPASHGV